MPPVEAMPLNARKNSGTLVRGKMDKKWQLGREEQFDSHTLHRECSWRLHQRSQGMRGGTASVEETILHHLLQYSGYAINSRFMIVCRQWFRHFSSSGGLSLLHGRSSPKTYAARSDFLWNSSINFCYISSIFLVCLILPVNIKYLLWTPRQWVFRFHLSNMTSANAPSDLNIRFLRISIPEFF